ncbi:hypothetical protein BGZ60DRAFT_524558 [Tricladium varicosporioides]|nr:hypothetical protein BGZ60DRAFT_524558 [Hymenoscyphus varicosporioides]
MPTYQSLDLLRSLRGAKEDTLMENKDQPEKQKNASPPKTVKGSTSCTENPPSLPVTLMASISTPMIPKEDTKPVSKPTPMPASTILTTSSPTSPPNPMANTTSPPTGPTLLEALSTPPPSTPLATKSRPHQPKDMTDQEYLSHLGHNSMYDFMSIYDLKTWRHGDYEEARTILHALRDREQERVEEKRNS